MYMIIEKLDYFIFCLFMVESFNEQILVICNELIVSLNMDQTILKIQKFSCQQ